MTDEVQHPGTEDPQEGPDIVEDDSVLDLDEAKEVIPYNFEMTAYGADYPVDALIARLSNGDLRIPTFGWEDPDNPDRVGFQRGFVWSKPQSDKFHRIPAPRASCARDLFGKGVKRSPTGTRRSPTSSHALLLL